MGGKNSMATWVKAGFASKDYTHFSFSGAQLISKMLYRAIYNELLNYRKQSKQNSLSKI
jgi:lysophospholipase L1-like esterase